MNRLVIADIKSVILNGKSTGHYFAVAENYVELFRNRVEIKIAGGPVFEQIFSKEDLIFLPYSINIGKDNKLVEKTHELINCKRLFKNCEGDTIVLQQSSVITSFLGILLYYHSKSHLFMIQYNNAGVDSKFGKLLFSLVKNKINGIICPNEKVGNAWQLPYCVVPDYIHTQVSKPYIPFEKRKYDLCFVGSICVGKGVLEAAKFVSKTNLKMVIAGTCNGDYKQQLTEVCNQTSNITFRPGLLSKKEYISLIKESKYGLLNYESEYQKRSSGVVLDFLYNGTPIIGRRCSALHLVEKYRAGILYNSLVELNNVDFKNSINFFQYYSGIQSFCAHNEHFRNSLLNFLQQY